MIINKQRKKIHNTATHSFNAGTEKNSGKLISLGLLSTFVYTVLTFYSNQSTAIDITPYIALFAIAFALYGYMAYQIFHHNSNPSIKIIIGFSIVFHIIGIIATPQFEDDFFRYLWDGYIFFESGNPYQHAPSDYFSDTSIPAIYQNLLNQINYPDIKTIYAPLLQYSFWLSHGLFPADILGLKIIYSVCNLAIIFMLVTLTKARNILLYAWNPLIIKEVAFTAHPDILGIVFLIAVIYFFSTKPKTAAICLGLSVCSKPFAWIIAVYILFRFKLTQCILFFLTIVVMYTPFLMAGNESSGLFAFGQHWEFNAAIYSLFSYLMPNPHAKMLCGGLFIAVMIYYFILFRKTTVANIRGDLLIGSLLLLSPVINPWYLLWVLPFTAMRNYITPWVMSFALLFSYFSGINLHSEHLQAYQLAIWVKPVEYTLMVCAITYDTRKYLANQPYHSYH